MITLEGALVLILFVSVFSVGAYFIKKMNKARPPPTKK